MAYNQQYRPAEGTAYSPGRSSPLRYTASNASTNSSTYSSSSDRFPPSRTSTLSSASSSAYQQYGAGHKRGISDMSPTRPSAREEPRQREMTAESGYKAARQSLRPLPQAPNTSPPAPVLKPYLSTQSAKETPKYQYDGPAYHPPSNTSQPGRPGSTLLGRAGSITPMSSASKRNAQISHTSLQGTTLAPPDLDTLKKSSTPYLRNLSKFAQSEEDEDFSMSSPAPSVAGLSGRRQLKRTGSIRPQKPTETPRNARTSAWAEANWMEKQRQFLQAYEYLCHIGEAKEWIEDVIHHQIPPIVQLEEALRDGVTLAEVVQAFYPDQPIRIFRHPKLQFRHSDNIALFFRFLADMELPELFRFELIDLYEKKNIPKVIYCIHALSWLLYRKGLVDFRIGNLVGQLEFEHHELEEMQRGLDKAGVSMPSFSGMGASFGAEPEPVPEPEPEPVETEEERIARELASHEEIILDLQSQIRGSMIRMGLGDTMQGLWDSEDMLVELQSIVRAKWAREIAGYRLSMQQFAKNLQSALRGFLLRRKQREKEEWWRGRESEVVMLQSLMRARRSRVETHTLKVLARRQESEVRFFQAAIRGALQRKEVEDRLEETQSASAVVDGLQAAIRGMFERQRIQQDQQDLQCRMDAVTNFQAAVRAKRQRQQITQQSRNLHEWRDMWCSLQATVRGNLHRQSIQATKSKLSNKQHSIAALQAHSRGKSLREELSQLKSSLRNAEISIVSFQTTARAHLLRMQLQTDLQHLRKHNSKVLLLQSHFRGRSSRDTQNQLINDLFANKREIVQLQALSRALLLRSDVGALINDLDDQEPIIAELQAAIRAKHVRERFVEKKRFFKANMEKVIKVQSFVRAKLQGEAYKSLTSGANPPVGTVKGFVHLLNDSDFDFDEEVEFERLRKTVVQHVRQNEMADQYITQLDIKIALLVKNKITLDEVVKHQKHFGGDAGSLLTNTGISSKDPLDLKALNKNSRRKLEHYQELFFILQTQPQYLARLFRRIREQATAEKECERVKHLMMGLFGYAQKRREEYYLIKLMTRAMKEEIDGCESIQDYLRGNFFWVKIFRAYIKSPRDRKFMRDILSPVVKDSIIDNPELDLESDPMQIYHSCIENEELRTGQRSQRSPEIPREAAIRDEETKRTFITHLQDLRDIADQFFAGLEDNLQKMPFGVRYIAQQMFQTLSARFQYEEQGYILQVVGHWLWKSYLQPALTEPEKFGVVDRGLSREHKRNIGEVSKVVGQVAAGRLFGGENVFLQPLNSYVGESIERLGETWGNLIDVPNAEAQFDIDEFNDLYSRTKPTLYIKMADIFSVHHLVAADASQICLGNRDDILQEVIRELGSVKNNENELMNVSTSEICLTLNPKLHETEDPDAEVKALMMETKRCILYIIRVQSGGDLMEIMVKPVTMEDEERWDMLVQDELSAESSRRGAYAEANTTVDIGSMSYAELKRTALENILQLEQWGRLTRHNHYQDLLNAIAVDIRTKHRRRIQRQRELETVKLTLARLNDQATYLEQQLKTYNDYIEQAMVTLQNKKGKKRFLMPFTKQWDHERELQRSGRTPKFGSFKYSAQDLANRGILVAWDGYDQRQWAHIDLTISSNEVGVFTIEGSNGPIAMPGASAQVPLDDLLQAQFNNTQFLEFFPEGRIRVNVNLFVHLIMRKFYKDRD
ncbi:iqgap-related protein [Lecanora helva]